jgi:hypothetical protein
MKSDIRSMDDRPGHRREASLPAPRVLALAIQSVAQIDDLGQLGEVIAFARTALTPDALPRFLADRIATPYTDTQLIAVGLAIPLGAAPARAYAFLAYLVPKSVLYPRPIRACLLMRMARAAVLAGEAAALARTGELQRRYGEERALYQLPLLFLTAHTDQPFAPDALVSVGPRTDALAHYYGGVNRLLAGQFAAADRDLARAWALARHAGDARAAVARANALSVFLCGKPRAVLDARIGVAHRPLAGAAAAVWGLDGPPPPASRDALCARLGGAIAEERARRIIGDLARSASRIRARELAALCGLPSVEHLLPGLLERDGIAVQIRDQILEFKRPSLAPRIAAEILALAGRQELQ